MAQNVRANGSYESEYTRIAFGKRKNQIVVEYSLAGYQNPIGVAEWKNQIVKALPEELKSSLPSIEEIEKELE